MAHVVAAGRMALWMVPIAITALPGRASTGPTN
jgi:hypothetical protein